MPVDWGGESIPLSARTLKGRTQIELTQARTVLGRLSQLIRRSPVGRASGCPPNCAVALGQRAAPTLLTTMRAQLQLVQHEISAAKTLRPGHLTTWIEGIDSDLHRRIGPSRQLTPTQLALSCGSGATAGVPATVTGQLTPAVANQPIAIQVSGGPGGGSQTVTTSASGSFTVGFTPGAAGNYTISASYAGTTTYGPSSATCPLAVANPAPAQSRLSLNCPETANPEQPLTVTAQLSPPLQGAIIDMSATGPGTVPSQTVATDATGLAYYNFTIGNAGAWTVSARWTGDATHQATSATCTISVRNPSTLDLTCPANPLPPTTPASVNGTLTPAVNASAVSITYTPPSTSGQQPTTDNVTTDNTGYYADSFGENASGTWTVTAKFAGDTTRAPATASCTFTVLSP
jgi:hypothetical protein